MPGTSTTRTAAGVILRAPTFCASASSRGSAICAIPTCSLPEPVASARVSARKSVVFPELGSPTIPISSATTSAQVEEKPTRPARTIRL